MPNLMPDLVIIVQVEGEGIELTDGLRFDLERHVESTVLDTIYGEHPDATADATVSVGVPEDPRELLEKLKQEQAKGTT